MKLCNSTKITDDVRGKLLYERMCTNFVCNTDVEFLSLLSKDIEKFDSKKVEVRF